MYRGTTPTLTFTLPIEANTITALNVALAQFGRVVVEKGLSEVLADGRTVSVTLTEDESLSLNAGVPLRIQLRVAVGDARMASQIFEVPVESILKEGKLDELCSTTLQARKL